MASIRLVLPIPLDPTRTVTPGFQGQVNLCVAAEIGQRKVFEVHAGSTIPGPGGPAGSYLAGRVACPPNWWRSAETIFMAGELSSREAEPGKECCRDGRCGHGVGDGFFHGPAAFAGILHVVIDGFQARILVQRLDHEVQQPGPDHCSLLPGPEGSRQVGDDVLGCQEFVAFGVGLHQAVFDAVVHHFGVVAGTDLANVDEAVRAVALGTESIEDRQGTFDVFSGAAGHQAVAVLQAPDATGNTAVGEADALGGKDFAVLLVFGEAGVAAVDHQVARLELVPEFGDDRIGDGSGGNHDPDDPRAWELLR